MLVEVVVAVYLERRNDWDCARLSHIELYIFGFEKPRDDTSVLENNGWYSCKMYMRLLNIESRVIEYLSNESI